ncbi:MAG: hypothetical protein HQL32_01875 [Planctomycetes bacterium]|nr:hypothetical protein [Planctomycetota bacterium]
MSLKEQLNQEKWQLRNAAVKKLGLDKSPENAQLLTEVLRDKRPSKWWANLLGEKFHQVGFIRRNAWASLKNQNPENFPLEELAMASLQDPYYEVQSACLRTLYHHLRESEITLSQSLEARIKARILSGDNFEIRLAAIPFLSFIYEKDEIQELAAQIVRARHWRVRGAFLEALCYIVEKGAMKREEVEALLRPFNMRSEYFKPIFLLKEQRAKLDQMLLEKS